MEQTQTAPQEKMNATKHSLGFLFKKYFWVILAFFIIAVISGVAMADYDAKSTTGWQTFTSKDAGLSFQYPSNYKIVEDKGWRITVYTSEKNSEDNIKILYKRNDPNDDQAGMGSQINANCQPVKVNAINAVNGNFKVYEDNTCNGLNVGDTVLVYTENSMNYDLTLFGSYNRAKIYTFLSTFKFEKTPIIHLPLTPEPSQTPTNGKMCGGIAAIACPTGFECKLDGKYPDAAGTCAPSSEKPMVSCRPRPACLDATPRCMIPETADMCPPPTKQTENPNDQVMCTMDAKQCPDGSWVGRSGPKCEFVCPH